MTIAAVDRLVIQDDEAAARLWPTLGSKVRDAYLADRDAWIVLRRKADAGSPPSTKVLASSQRTFAGWARAFHVAGRTPRRRGSAHTAPIVAVPTAQTRAATTASSTVREPAALPATSAVAEIPKPGRAGSATGAVAGGLVLAGLLAFAARRKRA